MNCDIKISILVPVYNAERYIGRCARSLFSQTYSNLEFVFVNDCTPDCSLEVLNLVLAEYPARQQQTKIISHEKNSGVALARNTLLANATGDYLLWVDADDFIDHRAAEILACKALETRADIVCFGAAYYYDNGSTRPTRRTVETSPHGLVNDLLSNTTTTSVWGRLVRRSIYNDHGISFVEGLNLGEDFLVMLKVAYYAKSVARVDDIFYFYNAANDQSIVHSYSEQKADMELDVLRLVEKFFKGKLNVSQYVEERRYRLNLYKLYCACLDGDRQEYTALKDYFRHTGSIRCIRKAYLFFLLCNNFTLNRLWSYLMNAVKRIVRH